MQDELYNGVTLTHVTDVKTMVTVRGQSAQLGINGEVLTLPAGDYVITKGKADKVEVIDDEL